MNGVKIADVRPKNGMMIQIFGVMKEKLRVHYWGVVCIKP
jgi:hypothetical protein